MTGKQHFCTDHKEPMPFRSRRDLDMHRRQVHRDGERWLPNEDFEEDQAA